MEAVDMLTITFALIGANQMYVAKGKLVDKKTGETIKDAAGMRMITDRILLLSDVINPTKSVLKLMLEIDHEIPYESELVEINSGLKYWKKHL